LPRPLGTQLTGGELPRAPVRPPPHNSSPGRPPRPLETRLTNRRAADVVNIVRFLTISLSTQPLTSPCYAAWRRRLLISTLIFVEHPLDLIRLSRLRQGQLQKDARLLWTQVIGGDETWLLPIVISNHPAGAESGAAYDDNTGRVVQLFQDFSCILSVAGTGAG